MLENVITVFETTSWLFYLVVIFTGLSVGSFLNVLILRMPRRMQAELGQACAELDGHEAGEPLPSRWFGLDYRRAIAYTLILVGVFWNGTGALTLGILGEIRWSWLPALLLGSLLGGYLGAHLAIKSGNRWIKRAFEIVTLLVGLKLIAG